MYVCKRDLSQECKGSYRDCTDCVLDKIRSEIDDLEVYYDNDYFCGNKDAMYKRNEVLQIIDKYKTEVRKTK